MAEKITLFEVDVKMDQVLTDTENLRKKTSDLKAEADSYRGTTKENTAEHIRAQAAYKASAAELRSLENVTTKLSSANTANAGTITKLEAENAKLRLEQKALNLETKAGIERNKEINNTINKNTAFIKENSDAQKQQTMNIGAYGNKLGELPGAFGGAVKGFVSMTKAALAFVATPIGAIIAAIVVVVTALVGIFKKFQPLIDWIEQKFAAVSAVISVLKDAFLSLFSGTKTLSESFSGLGSSMKDAAMRAQELKKAQQDLEDQQLLLIESEAKSKRQIDELLLQSKDRTKSEKERIALINEALKIEEESYNKKKKLIEDEYNQKVEQIAINNRLTDEEKKNLSERGAAYLLELQNTKAIDDDEVKSFAELSAKKEEILDESITIREKAINRQNALLEKQEAEEAKRIEAKKKKDEEDAKKKEELDKKILEEHQKYLDAEAEAERVIAAVKEEQRREARDKEREERQKERDRKIEERQLELENEYEIEQLRGSMLFDLDRERLEMKRQEEVRYAETIGADVNQVNEKYKLMSMKITQEEIRFKLGLASQFAGSLAVLFGKNTKVGKMAASAQVAIDTYQGAIAAYKGMIQVIPGPIGIAAGIIAGAAVGATGAKAISNIWAVKSGLPESGGSGGGGGSVNLSSGGGTSVPTPAPTVSNVNAEIGNGIVARDTTSLKDAAKNTVTTVLVVDNVTEAQARQESINRTQVT